MLKKFRKIAAFGASVTQQENGYVDQLSKKIGTKIKKFGYGGMHLPDAGVCFIDKVLSYRPELCLIDWFSTGYMECSEKTLQCIDTIIYKFSQSNCVLVFLILPGSRTDEKYNEQIEFYNFCRKAFKKRNVYFIDIDDELKSVDLSYVLRDSIHTTIQGGGVYADIIHRKLMENTPYCLNSKPFAENAKYKDIKRLKVNRVFFNQVNFVLDGEIIGIYNTIGRNSGLCKIITEDGSEKYVLIWDRWCYYERNHFDFFVPQCNGNVIIKVLNDVFDTGACKVPVDFKKYRKQIVCKEIYWQGINLFIDNEYEGSKLEFWKIEFVRNLREIKHCGKKVIKNILRK